MLLFLYLYCVKDAKIVPLIAILPFLLVNTNHTIKFKAAIFAVIPVALYAICYLVMAASIGGENGDWRYCALAMVLVLTFHASTGQVCYGNLLLERRGL